MWATRKTVVYGFQGVRQVRVQVIFLILLRFCGKLHQSNICVK